MCVCVCVCVCVCSPKFFSCWVKLVEMLTSGPAPTLPTFSQLCQLLGQFVETVVTERSRRQQTQPTGVLHRMWVAVGERFIEVVKKVGSRTHRHTHMKNVCIAY